MYRRYIEFLTIHLLSLIGINFSQAFNEFFKETFCDVTS